jgi:hypothetical protein
MGQSRRLGVVSSGCELSAADEWHVCRDHPRERHVGVEGQSRHVDDGIGRMPHLHQRFGAHRSVRLKRAPGQSRAQLRGSVADVDLSAGDVEPAALERDRLGQAGDGVLGGGLGDRKGPPYVGGNRPVVDDASALRILTLHRPEGLLGAQEATGEVRPDDDPPLVDRHLVERCGGTEHAGVVEQHVDAAPFLADAGE